MGVDLESRRLPSRDLRATVAVSGVVLAGALALPLVVPPGRVPSPAVTVLYLGMLVFVLRLLFQVGSSATMAAELIFIPALAVLPAPLIPLYVIAAVVVKTSIDVVVGGAPVSRLAMAPMWGAFALGPGIVLSATGSSSLLHSPGLIVAVVATQLLGDALANGAFEMARKRIGVREFFEEIRIVYAMDIALVPVGVMIALAVSPAPWRLVLCAPLLLVFAMLTRIRNAHVREALELSDAYHGMALVLGDIIEHDDTYTGEHSRGVVELSLQVAAAMGLNPEERLKVEFGARLHDVGKVAVPKEIINKAGALNAREWEIIRTHTVEGQRILDRAGGLMRDIGVIVRSSHERWDGTGYPDGLADTAIPVESRVVSACDAFNAMITDRSYRRAMSALAAIDELRRYAGSQFDPVVVQALIDVVSAPTVLVDAPAIVASDDDLPLAA